MEAFLSHRFVKSVNFDIVVLNLAYKLNDSLAIIIFVFEYFVKCE